MRLMVFGAKRLFGADGMRLMVFGAKAAGVGSPSQCVTGMESAGCGGTYTEADDWLALRLGAKISGEDLWGRTPELTGLERRMPRKVRVERGVRRLTTRGKLCGKTWTIQDRIARITR